MNLVLQSIKRVVIAGVLVIAFTASGSLINAKAATITVQKLDRNRASVVLTPKDQLEVLLPQNTSSTGKWRIADKPITLSDPIVDEMVPTDSTVLGAASGVRRFLFNFVPVNVEGPQRLIFHLSGNGEWCATPWSTFVVEVTSPAIDWQPFFQENDQDDDFDKQFN